MALATCLVTVPGSRHITIVLTNFSEGSIRLPGRTRVGRLVSAERYQTVANIVADEATSPATLLSPSSNSFQGTLPPGVKLEDPNRTNMTEAQLERLQALIIENSDRFASDNTRHGQANIEPIRIPTTIQFPSKRPYYRRYTREDHMEIERQVQKMLQLGTIRPSKSPWASPVKLVDKKNGEKRFCVDFTHLNAVTIFDTYPLKRIDELLETVEGATIFSVFDLMAGYHQFPITEKDRFKTAFWTRNGLYEYNALPMGLTNAPSAFQRVIDQVLTGLTWRFALVYLDDILVFSRTFDDHLDHLHQVFRRLREANLFVRGDKCRFALRKIGYLGHIITDTGITVDEKKVNPLRLIKELKSVLEVLAFLGMTGYYRRFIKNYATISEPLVQLTRKDVPFHWGGEQQRALDKLVEALSTFPVLCAPDFSKPFILETDASGLAVGAVLMQERDGVRVVIAYFSRLLNAHERRYGITELECLAVVESIEHFRPYLEGAEFVVITDHQALTWLFSRREASGRLGRWIMKLQQYKFSVKYRPGTLNAAADGLTRGAIVRFQQEALAAENNPPGENDNVEDRGVELQLAHKIASFLLKLNPEQQEAWLSNLPQMFNMDQLSPWNFLQAQQDDLSLAKFFRMARLGVRENVPYNNFFINSDGVLYPENLSGCRISEFGRRSHSGS